MTKLLTPEELSKLLRIPKRSVYKFAQEGYIPGGFRVGRHWRFKQEVIENWISEQGTARPLNTKK
ncbi:MAG: helix-turn-helix domain-containing protein [Candidatus Omnitrophica bacterium]|nr:helix-turn-helix domain-containing protein [Candidatus Omnitrophota bacterium]